MLPGTVRMRYSLNHTVCRYPKSDEFAVFGDASQQGDFNFSPKTRFYLKESMFNKDGFCRCN